MPAVSGNINPVSGFATSATTSTSTNTLTLTFGATPPANAIILVFATGNGGTGAWTGPSGYTAGPMSVTYATSARQTLCWAKISNGTETTATVTGTGTTTGIAMTALAFTGAWVDPAGLSATLATNYGAGAGGAASVTVVMSSVQDWTNQTYRVPWLAVCAVGASAGLASTTLVAGTNWTATTTAATAASGVGSAAIAAGYGNFIIADLSSGNLQWNFGSAKTFGELGIALYFHNGALCLTGMGA